MTETDTASNELTRIEDARSKGPLATLALYTKLSDPGWLQSAITLGGGSLASALYLGVLTGYSMLWLQPVAMILGIIMLSAIAYVTLSTGKRPFQAINEHVNPVLGWGWILAVAMANVVWSLPQFALGTAALQQNLFPEALGGETGKVICCALILGIATAVIWQYDSGAKGVKIFEGILKAMVGVVVLSFFGVVITLLTSEGGLPTGEILGGFVPDLSLLSQPASTFTDVLARTGDASAFWSARIVSQQQDVMIAAAATAVGINMTFLLPYSMLRKGWGKGHRGLGIFDLATGLFIPFLLATSCVVIASSSQFHTRFDQALVDDPAAAAANGGYLSALDARLSSDEGTALRLAGDEFEALDAAGKEDAVSAAFAYLTTADRELAATLQKRDAFALADALEPLTGSAIAQTVFGIGVLGMAISTVIILMLISGFAFCEMFGKEPRGRAHRMGALVAGLGVLGPFVWTGQAKFWLAVPTSVFGMVLLPIAYWTFFLMMNSRSLMGAERPEGGARLRWNTLMLLAAGIATYASLFSAWKKAGWYGLGALAAFLVLALVVGMGRKMRAA